MHNFCCYINIIIKLKKKKFRQCDIMSSASLFHRKTQINLWNSMQNLWYCVVHSIYGKKKFFVVVVVVREILNANIIRFNLLVAKVFAIISMDFITFYNSRCKSNGPNGKAIHFCFFFDKLVI